ncbi:MULTISPECIES: universal stress protein [Flavobacteriaceae]|uniref:universal stress protein n=1 Tax=Flavobacteriaceae TaxID=49546 RepID=UPI001492C312|nr:MULTISPECIES: universal stress protein [Allomuricauda]MDC6365941.1 universal stress protein [Muricauda sp. AC10]
MKKIVLPTDFSENAFNAICYAVELLENATCIFYLVHSYTPALYRVDYALGSPGQFGLPDDHQHQAETTLEKIRKRIKKKYTNPKHTFVTHAAFNSLEDEMASVVKNENIDLVVMGTQGATGAREILFGSNTVHIFRKSTVPVLAIPSSYKFNLPKEILFPTDYEVNYSNSSIETLFWMAKLWSAKLNVLHVTSSNGLTSEQEKNKKALGKLINDQSFKIYDLPDQELVEAINSFQMETTVDLLAMVKNKHSFLERLFIEPIIRNVGLHTNVPFLVLPYNSKS